VAAHDPFPSALCLIDFFGVYVNSFHATEEEARMVDMWDLCASCTVPAASNLSWMCQIVTA